MRLHLALLAAIAVTVAACTDLTEPGATRRGSPSRDLRAAALLTSADSQVAAAPQLLVCPTQETQVERALIGPGGGTFGVRGTSITIPAGAVPQPTLFEVVVPASRYMEVEIHAVGAESYIFARPVTVTINYARCPDDAAPPDANLQGVYIDSLDRVLELMGGVADKSDHKVTFATGHLSGYAVAY